MDNIELSRFGDAVNISQPSEKHIFIPESEVSVFHELGLHGKDNLTILNKLCELESSTATDSTSAKTILDYLFLSNQFNPLCRDLISLHNEEALSEWVWGFRIGNTTPDTRDFYNICESIPGSKLQLLCGNLSRVIDPSKDVEQIVQEIFYGIGSREDFWAVFKDETFRYLMLLSSADTLWDDFFAISAVGREDEEDAAALASMTTEQFEAFDIHGMWRERYDLLMNDEPFPDWSPQLQSAKETYVKAIQSRDDAYGQLPPEMIEELYFHLDWVEF